MMLKSKNIYTDDEIKQRTHALLDTTKSHEIIPEIIDFDYDTNNLVKVIDSLWEDSGLEDWSKKQTITHGGKYHMWNLIKSPTYDIELLKNRQNSYNTLPDNIYEKIEEISKYENDVNWIFTLPPLKESYPINILFPSIPILNYINKLPYLLTLFHIYRISIMPWFNILSPLITIFSPWFYLKKINFVVHDNLIHFYHLTI